MTQTAYETSNLDHPYAWPDRPLSSFESQLYSPFHREHQAYSDLPDTEVLATFDQVGAELHRPLTNEELIEDTGSFEVALEAYRKLTRRHMLGAVVKSVISFNKPDTSKVDVTTSLGLLDRIARKFDNQLNDTQKSTLESLIVKQLRRVRQREELEASSLVTLERIASVTDVLPEAIKAEGIEAFEETLTTIEIDIPNKTGETKLPPILAKAAHRAIELFKEEDVPLKEGYDRISRRNSKIAEGKIQKQKIDAMIADTMKRFGIDRASARKKIIDDYKTEYSSADIQTVAAA